MTLSFTFIQCERVEKNFFCSAHKGCRFDNNKYPGRKGAVCGGGAK